MAECINPLYWIIKPLDNYSSDTLLRIEAKIQPFAQKDRRLDIAYLIARECVTADFKTRTLTLTPKGQDACNFYRPNLKTRECPLCGQVECAVTCRNAP